MPGPIRGSGGVRNRPAAGNNKYSYVTVPTEWFSVEGQGCLLLVLNSTWSKLTIGPDRVAPENGIPTAAGPFTKEMGFHPR